jgi:hypothetical protein
LFALDGAVRILKCGKEKRVIQGVHVSKLSGEACVHLSEVGLPYLNEHCPAGIDRRVELWFLPSKIVRNPSVVTNSIGPLNL